MGSDVDLSGGVLTIRNGKGGKQRRVTLTPSLVTSLKALPQPGPVIGASQTAARQRLRLLAERAGTRYLGWHAYRHYAEHGLSGKQAAWNMRRDTWGTAVSRPPACTPSGATARSMTRSPAGRPPVIGMS